MGTEDDAGLPIAYQVLAAGTPVHAQDGGKVGTVIRSVGRRGGGRL